MTKRDFFIMILKLFGLFSIVTSLFSVFPTNLFFALMDIDTFSLTWVIVAVLVVMGLFVLLVFKSDKIVRLLKLDKGFDSDRIELGNLSSTDIVKIGSFIIGGLLFLDNIPAFLSHTLFAFKGSITGQTYGTKDIFFWIASGLNLVLGYLLMTNYSYVARLLRTTKKENEKTTTR